MRAWWSRVRAYWTDAPITCPWCKGMRIFHPHLPMSCPRCDASGQVHARSGKAVKAS